MRPTLLIGYGRFHLEAFRLGESFARYDGSIGTVAEIQPPLNNHIVVWVQTGPGSSRRERMLLHKHAPVHAVTREQALAIQRRLRRSQAKIGKNP